MNATRVTYKGYTIYQDLREGTWYIDGDEDDLGFVSLKAAKRYVDNNL